MDGIIPGVTRNGRVEDGGRPPAAGCIVGDRGQEDIGRPHCDKE
ncbi:hypothetical protein ACFV7R_26875 [Streptomyces sp. NPDC059866]|nr:hypothetical protein [Streptomyces sp. F001]